MRIVIDMLATLGMRASALKSLADRRSVAVGATLFAAGFVVFSLVRTSVYASLPDAPPSPSTPLGFLSSLNVIQSLVFLLLIYLPAVAALSDGIAGRGLRVSRERYLIHGSALLPLWGLLFLIAAIIQYFVPQFIVGDVVAVSVAILALLAMLAVYTVWALARLNALSIIQALGAFALSWITLPLYYLLSHGGI